MGDPWAKALTGIACSMSYPRWFEGWVKLDEGHGVITFLHAADLHLDSPLRSLERYEGLPIEAVKRATRRALDRLVDHAIDSQVSAVLIAGDLYDGDWKDFNTGLHFVRQMARLSDSGIPAILIAGNHDAASKMTRRLRLPPGVTMMSDQQPETLILEDLGLAVHGQSFAKPAVTDNLARGYPEPVRGFFNVGLLHTSADGRPGHERYAPCALDDLRLKGYDYWGLGHIHQREILAETPTVAFPGNTQGRHAKETGAKGCFEVRVDQAGTASLDFVELGALRWERWGVELTEVVDADDAFTLIEDELARQYAAIQPKQAVVRLTLTGVHESSESWRADEEQWRQEIRAAATRVSQGNVGIEKIVWQMSPARDRPLIEEAGLNRLIRENLELLEGDESLLADALADLSRKLPKELKEQFDQPTWRREMARQSARWLRHRLSRPAGDGG